MAGWLIMAFGILAVLGAFMPWASVGPFSVAGVDGDGAITLVLGLIAAGLGVVRGVVPTVTVWQIIIPIAALIIGGLVALIGAIDTVSVSEQATPGPGLILTAIAGLGVVGSSVFALIIRK